MEGPSGEVVAVVSEPFGVDPTVEIVLSQEIEQVRTFCCRL